jgi:hypothetical protein
VKSGRNQGGGLANAGRTNELTNPVLRRQMVTTQEAMMMVVTMMGRKSLMTSMSVLK